MVQPDLTLIGIQLDRILNELRSMRDELMLLRGEFQLLREQVRIQGAAIGRISDTLTMNVLDRIRALEER